MENALAQLVLKTVKTLHMLINNKIILSVFLITTSLISCKQKSTKNLPVQDPKATEVVASKVEKLPYFNTPDFTPMWLSDDNELKEYHKIPNFSLTNQLGNQVTNKTLKGSIYVASFFFTTCPNICVQLTHNMHTLQKAYASDPEVKLVSHTVLPTIDTVEVLKAFGERQNIDPQQWYLLTGEKDKIYELVREAYFADDLYKKTNDKDRFVHTENIILIDKNSHIRGVYNGTLPKEMKRVQRHIEILKNE